MVFSSKISVSMRFAAASAAVVLTLLPGTGQQSIIAEGESKVAPVDSVVRTG